MIYSKKEIGQGLKEELNKGYNIPRISSWADEVFISIRNKRIPELDNILRHILMMDAGPEFEYSEEELRMLAELLINEDQDSISEK